MIKILRIILILLIFFGCSDSKEKDVKYEISTPTTTIDAGSEEDDYTFKIDANTHELTPVIEYDKTCCFVTYTQSEGAYTVNVSVRENHTYEDKKFTIKFYIKEYPDLSVDITVNQKGKTYIKLEGVSIQHTVIELSSDEIFTPDVVFTPEDAVNKNHTWEISNTDVVNLNEDGSFTAKQSGESTITIRTEEGDFKDDFKIIVLNPVRNILFGGFYYDASLTRLHSNSGSINLCHGDVVYPSVIFSPENATNKKYIIKSSSDAIRIGENNEIVATSDNSIHEDVQITVYSDDDKNIFGSCLINVSDVYLSASGKNIVQGSGTTNVTFKTTITTSFDKGIYVGGVMLIDQNRQIIQMLSEKTGTSNSIRFDSNKIDVSYLGLTGDNLLNTLCKWKFVYTYKIQGESEYRQKEVFINAKTWSN